MLFSLFLYFTNFEISQRHEPDGRLRKRGTPEKKCVCMQRVKREREEEMRERRERRERRSVVETGAVSKCMWLQGFI